MVVELCCGGWAKLVSCAKLGLVLWFWLGGSCGVVKCCLTSSNPFKLVQVQSGCRWEFDKKNSCMFPLQLVFVTQEKVVDKVNGNKL